MLTLWVIAATYVIFGNSKMIGNMFVLKIDLNLVMFDFCCNFSKISNRGSH